MIASPVPVPRFPPRRTILLAVVGIAVALLLVYGQSLRNEFVRWDDGMLIYENAAIREISPQTLRWIFTNYDPELYIPLTFFTYQLDYLSSGTNPFGYHLTSLLLHILNAILVAALFYALTGRRWTALLAGLVFGLHPLHTEAVAWASGRKDVLSTAFFLGSLLLYLRYREWGSKRSYYGSLVLFLFGLLSKVMVGTLPVVLLLLDYLAGRKFTKQVWLEKIPYVALSVVFGLVALFGKRTLVSATSLWDKILMACKSTVFYIVQVFFPTHFSLLYPYTEDISLRSPDFLIPLILVVLLLAAILFFRNRARWFTVGILFYLITVSPTFLNFSKGGDLDVYFASDRYAYVPSIGLFFVGLVAVGGALEKFRIPLRAQQGMAAALVVILAFLSYRQSQVWRDTKALFENVIRYYPASSYVAHNNLGNMERLDGDLDSAIAEYQESVAIRPHAKVLSNLGAAYRKKKMYPEALATYDRALAVLPSSSDAYFGLGIIHAEQGDFAKAEEEYKLALSLDPYYEQVYVNLGVLYVQQGRLPEAVNAYREALRIAPFHPEARFNLAVALGKQGKNEEAVPHYEHVVRFNPGFVPARINLGLLYASLGRREESIAQFQEILKIQPGNAAAAEALRQLGAL